MAPFELKNGNQFVGAPDQSKVEVYELRSRPATATKSSGVKRSDWAKVGTVIAADSPNPVTHNSLKVVGRDFKAQALRRLAGDLAKSRLLVNREGLCYVDVTGGGFGVDYFRVQDLFGWWRYGVEVAGGNTDDQPPMEDKEVIVVEQSGPPSGGGKSTLSLTRKKDGSIITTTADDEEPPKAERPVGSRGGPLRPGTAAPHPLQQRPLRPRQPAAQPRVADPGKAAAKNRRRLPRTKLRKTSSHSGGRRDSDISYSRPQGVADAMEGKWKSQRTFLPYDQDVAGLHPSQGMEYSSDSELDRDSWWFIKGWENNTEVMIAYYQRERELDSGGDAGGHGLKNHYYHDSDEKKSNFQIPYPEDEVNFFSYPQCFVGFILGVGERFMFLY
ncbi:unnamed protein product [Linum tenue]|uniref:Uncharacterized protein n=1 Tax=Linum tenue TaxID=586396 RepID=A0AAV0NAS2_9ROSI|nr:unnamed protein product [Linum tenue]